MFTRLRVIAVWICLTLPGTAWCTKSMRPGEPYLGLGLRIGVTPRVGDVFPLRVEESSAQHGTDCLGKVRISVPEGIQVIKGDLSREVHVSIQETKHANHEQCCRRLETRLGASTVDDFSMRPPAH
jgi:hypothetical protein